MKNLFAIARTLSSLSAVASTRLLATVVTCIALVIVSEGMVWPMRAVPDVSPKIAISVSPTSLAFGNQPVDPNGPAQSITLTITNTGVDKLQLTDLSLSGPAATDFMLVPRWTGP